MSPLKHSNNFAARMGRWSASHWKTASSAGSPSSSPSFAVGMRRRYQADHRPERRRTSARPAQADQILDDAGFQSTDPQTEHRDSSRARRSPSTIPPSGRRSPTSSRALARVREGQQPALAARRRRTPARSRPDGHTAMVEFSPKGTYDVARALHRRDHGRHRRASRGRHPGFYVGEAGVSIRQGARQDVQRAAREGRRASIPLTLRRSCCSCSARSSPRVVPLLLALTAVFATIGPRRAAEPARPDGPERQRRAPARRARRRRRLLALLPQARA